MSAGAWRQAFLTPGAGRRSGWALAAACLVALIAIGVRDAASGPASSLGALSVLPILVAGWRLPTRMLTVLAAAAIGLRLGGVALGAVRPETGAAEAVAVLLVAAFSHLMALNVAEAASRSSRAQLVWQVARIAASGRELADVVGETTLAMERAGFGGGGFYLVGGEGRLRRFTRSLPPVSPAVLHALESVRPVLESRELAAPLVSAGRALGVVSARRGGDQPAFTGGDLASLEQVALALGAAFQQAEARAAAEQHLQRRLRELSVVLDAARALSQYLEPERMLPEICRAAAEIITSQGVGPRRSSVVMIADGMATVAADHDEQGDSLAGMRFPLSEHPGIARAYSRGRTTTARAADLRGSLVGTVKSARLVSGAHAPIRLGSEVVGVLSVSTRVPYTFEASELRLLGGMADLAGLALGNAQSLLLEQRRSEELRQLAERAAALEKSKTEFLRLASHELRGPIAVLRGYVSMLEEGSLGRLAAGARAVLPTLAAKVEAMNLLIDQMLETARLDDSRLELRLEHCDVRDLVRKCVATARGAARPQHRLEVAVPEHPVVVLADRARLQTIVGNLVDNALKYSPEGGSVRCEVSKAGGLARVEVSDQGMGIRESDMAKLFTRFGRVVSAENSHIAGTGLGLYLSRELARMHGGDLYARSEFGVGSSFVLELPLAPVAAGSAAAPAAAGGDQSVAARGTDTGPV